MVTVTELELAISHSHGDLSSYLVDFGLRSESVKDTSHSSHTAVMRDLLSSNGAPGGNDVNYPLLDNSPSIINLLSDKLDSQSKATNLLHTDCQLHSLLNHFSSYLKQCIIL